MVVHEQAPAGLRREAVDLVAVDHRVGAAVRVHEHDLALGGGERALDDRDHRRDSAAAGEGHDRDVSRVQHEQAGGPHHVERVARRERVVHPVRHHALGDPLHRRREAVAGVGRTRHRVATHHGLSGDGRPERAELPGDVRERVRELGRDVEHERSRVGRLVDHVDDRQCVVLVVGMHRISTERALER